MSGRLTHIEIWLQKISHYNSEVIFLIDSSNDETFSDLKAIVESNNYEKVKIINGYRRIPVNLNPTLSPKNIEE